MTRKGRAGASGKVKRIITPEEQVLINNGIEIIIRDNNRLVSAESLKKILHRDTIQKDRFRLVQKYKLYNLNTILSQLKIIKNNPYVIEYQKQLGYFDDLKYEYKKEVLVAYEIIKNVPYVGEWQYPVDVLGKKYIIDYAFLQTRIGIEIDEPGHISKTNKSDDKYRQDSLKMHEWDLIRIKIRDVIDYDELKLDIEYINAVLKYKDRDITIEKLKEEFGDFTDLGEFCKMFGLQIINSKKSNNPFQIYLSDALSALQINKNTDVEKYKSIMEMFGHEEDNKGESDEKTDSDRDNESDDGIDSDRDNDSDDEIDLDEESDDAPYVNDKDMSNEDQNKSLQWFEEDIDFKIDDNGEIIITREAFTRLSINVQTVTGKMISKMIDKFISMIDKYLFKQYNNKDQYSIDLHQKMIEREVRKQRDFKENVEIMKLNQRIQNMEKALLKKGASYHEIQKCQDNK